VTDSDRGVPDEGVTVITADDNPLVVGANVTGIVRVPPAGSVAGKAGVVDPIEKGPDEIETPVTVTGEFAVTVRFV
jgi:hypothetical protein